MKEIWKPVEGYPGYYISNLGRVKGKRNTMLKPQHSERRWYPFVNLYKNGRRKNINIHNLVAKSFLGSRPKGMDIHHIDGDRFNCRVDNLTYVTHAENIRLIKKKRRVNMSGQDDQNVGKVAPYVFTPCDDGHYGITECGECGEILIEKPLPSHCPKCGVRLQGFKQEIIPGGQDEY